MSNLNNYKNTFKEALGLDAKIDLDKLEYNQIPEWDSIGHMTLVSSLEEKFEITLNTEDIVDFSSFSKGKDILSKYKIDFEK